MSDKKKVTVLLLGGAEMGILTKMPLAEITREMNGDDKTDPNWVILEALTMDDEKVEVYLSRVNVLAFVRAPFNPPSNIAVPRAPGIVQ